MGLLTRRAGVWSRNSTNYHGIVYTLLLMSLNFPTPSSGKAYDSDSGIVFEKGRIGMDWPRLLAYINGTVD